MPGKAGTDASSRAEGIIQRNYTLTARDRGSSLLRAAIEVGLPENFGRVQVHEKDQ